MARFYGGGAMMVPWFPAARSRPVRSPSSAPPWRVSPAVASPAPYPLPGDWG